ncbi:hypothetical protein COV05_01465 [Candidatus Uhrbacteria bacterium CG10_big_fil_rev_8_21_14_0_10_48_16]|uniref:Uncharacterized protein n=1 Tax=Candidatus Uhrbacteria bacterium CG10_big_fil_rev_8_21_14_0_10_48_16 TaxID=1975038 RepID=A0A2M8LI32_9BACT|nr:MAG: hypothetical protein COV05_01465 [Candidatus Uhrbacteria bacterium CG10_big_fil_rev_8_21_14_0_10_48_16]
MIERPISAGEYPVLSRYGLFNCKATGRSRIPTTPTEEHDMGTKMPVTVKCCRCPRELPPNGEVKGLPVLVVLEEATSAEDAIAKATCHWCLKDEERPGQSLLIALANFGVKKDDPLIIPALGTPTRTPTLSPTLHTGGPRSDMGPSLKDVSIAGRPTRSFPRTTPSPRWDNAPKLPRALQAPARPPPAPKVKSLRGGMGDRNMEVLREASVAARARAEKKCQKVLFFMRLLLGKVRKISATSEVWNLVETFYVKLDEAVKLDVEQRGKKGLLEFLGTSYKELDELCLLVYQHMSVKPGRLAPRTYSSKSRDREVVTIDAFAGMGRPEHWTSKGAGRQAGFYQFEVVRTKSVLPDPNDPLTGDVPNKPRIIYPEGGQYGSEFEVENSRDNQLETLCVSFAGAFGLWLTRHHEALEIGEETAKVDFSYLIELFFAFLKLKEKDEEADDGLATEAEHLAPSTSSLALPATT